MERIQINVYLPHEVALRLGITQFGKGTFAPTDAQLLELTDEERAFLADGEGSGRYIHIDDIDDRHGHDRHIQLDGAVSWDTVCRAIAREAAAKRAKKAADEAADEKRIQAALAATLEEWIIAGSRPGLTRRPPSLTSNGPTGIYLGPDNLRDPRIVARIAEVKASLDGQLDAFRVALLEEYLASDGGYNPAYLNDGVVMRDPRVIAHYEAHIAGVEAARAAMEAIKEAEKEGVKAEMTAFALTVPALARPAADGYAVLGAVGRHLATEVADADPTAYHDSYTENTDAWDKVSFEERASPSPFAFALLDKITAHVATVRRPDCVTITVSRIQRITIEKTDSYDGVDNVFTGIIVEIVCPTTKDRYVVFSAE